MGFNRPQDVATETISCLYLYKELFKRNHMIEIVEHWQF